MDLKEFLRDSRYITSLSSAISMVGTIYGSMIINENRMTTLQTLMLGVTTYACSSFYLTITDGICVNDKNNRITLFLRKIAFLLKKFSIGFATSMYEISSLLFGLYSLVNSTLVVHNDNKYKYLLSAYSSAILTNMIVYAITITRPQINERNILIAYISIPVMLLFIKYKTYRIKKLLENKNYHWCTYYLTHA